MGVSKNNGTPKSSILIGFSIINHPILGYLYFGNTHMDPDPWVRRVGKLPEEGATTSGAHPLPLRQASPGVRCGRKLQRQGVKLEKHGSGCFPKMDGFRMEKPY